MDFELSDEQRLLQDTVRQFVDDRILPNAIENDIEHRLDLGAIAGMAELGILGIVIPEEHDGSGLDFVCEALACEEIERGEAAFRTLISVHVGLNSLALLKYGSAEQHERWLAPQARGDKLATRRRRLRPERLEELDLVRERRRPRARVREDRSIRATQGHLGVHARA